MTTTKVKGEYYQDTATIKTSPSFFVLREYILQDIAQMMRIYAVDSIVTDVIVEGLAIDPSISFNKLANIDQGLIPKAILNTRRVMIKNLVDRMMLAGIKTVKIELTDEDIKDIVSTWNEMQKPATTDMIGDKDPDVPANN